MSRLPIELTDEEHNKIESDAFLIKLDVFLEPRIKDAKNGNVIFKTARDVFKETLSDQ